MSTISYPLESPDERARLRRQSDQLRPHSADLLSRLDLQPGAHALDLGCGPSGILELLAAAVGPTGRVLGVDANPALVSSAREYARSEGLHNVEVQVGDAVGTGLLGDSFDLVHARTVLATVQEPAKVVAEMVRLARPGGWVAGQEPDVDCSICHPALPAWDRLRELFRAGFGGMGADLLIGRRLGELYREAGLVDIDVVVHAGTYPVGHSRRTILPDLVRSLRPQLIGRALADEAELDQLDREVRAHLADPATFVMTELMVVTWGRKP
jgi:SAM-dependent methyltransferase